MKATTLLYPGTFDPITLGHVDILRRACSLAGRLVVGVAASVEKQTMFSPQERLEMARLEVEALRSEVEVSIEALGFDGLLVDFVAQVKADAILRGSPFSHRLTKELVYEGFSRSVEEHIPESFKALQACFRSEDHHEGVRAFLEKREARFTGR